MNTSTTDERGKIMNIMDKWNFASELVQKYGVETRNTKIKHLLLEAIKEASDKDCDPKIISAMYIDLAEFYRCCKPLTPMVRGDNYSEKINKQYQAFAWKYAEKAEELNPDNEDVHFIKAQLLQLNNNLEGYRYEMVKFYEKTNEPEKIEKLLCQ